MALDAKHVDHAQVLKNIEQMINIMEFDAMRSAGKAKMNAANLVDMYKLKEIYTTKLKASKKEAN